MKYEEQIQGYLETIDAERPEITAIRELMQELAQVLHVNLSDCRWVNERFLEAFRFDFIVGDLHKSTQVILSVLEVTYNEDKPNLVLKMPDDPTGLQRVAKNIEETLNATWFLLNTPYGKSLVRRLRGLGKAHLLDSKREVDT